MSHTCTYCGVSHADTLDHVIPRSVGGKLNEGFKKTNTVPACRECNLLLSNRLFLTVGSRAAFLAGAIEGRYRKVLRLPKWSEDELEDLSGPMRRTIKAQVALAEETRARVLSCEKVSLEAPTVAEVWEGTLKGA